MKNPTTQIIPNFMAYIAGPYRAETAWGIDQNIQAARRVSASLWEHGIANFCPHANTAHFDGIAPDEVFLEGGLIMLRRCDAVVLVGKWWESAGTRAEIEEAKRLGIPVFLSAFCLVRVKNRGEEGFQERLKDAAEQQAQTDQLRLFERDAK